MVFLVVFQSFVFSHLTAGHPLNKSARFMQGGLYNARVTPLHHDHVTLLLHGHVTPLLRYRVTLLQHDKLCWPGFQQRIAYKLHRSTTTTVAHWKTSRP